MDFSNLTRFLDFLKSILKIGQHLRLTFINNKALIPEILTTAPGAKESVVFGDDGMTLLNQVNKDTPPEEQNKEIEININLEEVVDSNTHLAGDK